MTAILFRLAFITILAFKCNGQFTLTLCDGESHRIYCHGKLSISKAMYGRHDKDICASLKTINDNCSTARALGILKRRCDGKTTCLLHASTNVFGDPCPGTHKYLRVDFTCIKNYLSEDESVYSSNSVSNAGFHKKWMRQSEEIKKMQKEIRKMKIAQQMSKRVAFMAELSSNISPRTGQTVVFNQIHLNIGNGYSANTGVFTAPVNGIYHFTLDASSNTQSTSKLLHLRIIKGKKQVAYVFLDGNNDRWLKRYTSVVLKLVAKEQVFVRVTYTRDNPVLNGEVHHTQFGGYLIHAMY